MSPKAPQCPRCFAHSVGTIAGACCPACSIILSAERAIRIAQGDQANQIIENATIKATGRYWVCEWAHCPNEDLTLTGYSVHAEQRDALTARAWHFHHGKVAHVVGPFDWPPHYGDVSGPIPPQEVRP